MRQRNRVGRVGRGARDKGTTRARGVCIALAFAVTALALIALFVFAVCTGSLDMDPEKLFRGLFVAYDEDVATVYDLRFPRIFIAMVGGAATAVSGVLLQAVIRNPLADPGIIGVSAGASLAAMLVTAFAPMLFLVTPLFAFAGGAAAFLVVYSLSWGRSGLSPLRIILVGVAVSAVLSGLSSAFNAGTGSALTGVASIVNANISMKTWSDFTTIACYAIPVLVISLALAHRCDLLALEDKTARSLGVDVNRTRMAVSCVAVLLASVSTAVIGPISFLGLVVPHLARLIVGSGHRALIPYTMVLGAFCLLAADTLGRIIAPPYEISAATIMAVIGGPVFIFLLRRSRYSYGE